MGAIMADASNTAVCPSGQREQTVNLPAQPTLVRTQQPPPQMCSLPGHFGRAVCVSTAPRGSGFADAGPVELREPFAHESDPRLDQVDHGLGDLSLDDGLRLVGGVTGLVTAGGLLVSERAPPLVLQ